MINPLSLFSEARNTYGYTGTLVDAQTAVASVDRQPLEAAETARYRIEVWDEVSPLAGKTPEWWRTNRSDWPLGGKVYLIYVDGNLQTVQPHNPLSAGFMPMTEVEALILANRMVAVRVEEAVDAQVKERALLSLLSA